MSGPPIGFGYAGAVHSLQTALRFGINPSLDGIKRLTDAMGRPQDSFASIQVGGTNGKSSVSRMTAAILREHGLRVGCYTSPHLIEYRERIEVDGGPVSEADFARGVQAALDASKQSDCSDHDDLEPTEFELLTAAALWLFRDLGLEIAVLEVGMGGRWDATSVVSPRVATITGVALDHMEHLGDTLGAIAAEKACIIGPGSAVVLGPGTARVEDIFLARAASAGVRDVISVRPAVDPESGLGSNAERAEKRDAPGVTEVGFEVLRHPESPRDTTLVSVSGLAPAELQVPMFLPAYQAENVATSLATSLAALDSFDSELAIVALSRIEIPGRFQVAGEDPWLVVDGAHNPQGAEVLAQAIKDAFGTELPIVILGVLADKDAEGIAAALASVAREFAAVTPDNVRGMDAEQLQRIVLATSGKGCTVFDSMAAALAEIHEHRGQNVVVAGSLATVADALIAGALS